MKRSLLLALALVAGCTARSAPAAQGPQAVGPPVTLVTIGGDETYGADLPHDERFRLSWPQLLYRSLPSRATFTNLGTQGATTASALATQVPIARSLQPTIVVVWLDGDAAAGIPVPTSTANLVRLLQQLRQNAADKVVVIVGPQDPGTMSYDDATRIATQAASADLVDLTSLPTPLGVSGHRAAADAITAAIGPVN